MSALNRLTVVAAMEVIERFHTHDEMSVLEVQWDIQQHVGAQGSKAGRVADWAEVAMALNPIVWTESGLMPLQHAIVDLARTAPEGVKSESRA